MSRNGSDLAEVQNVVVTSREGRVSRNRYQIRKKLAALVTSREGRVSRNEARSIHLS